MARKTASGYSDAQLDLIVDRLTQRIGALLTPVINEAVDRAVQQATGTRRYVRTGEVVSEMETSYATLKRWIADGMFPPPVAGSPTRRWLRKDLEDIKRLGSWAKVLEERGGAA